MTARLVPFALLFACTAPANQPAGKNKQAQAEAAKQPALPEGEHPETAKAKAVTGSGPQGTCKVKSNDGRSWEVPVSGPMALGTTYWEDPGTPAGGPLFTFNCVAKDLRLHFSASQTSTAETFPYEPARYTIQKPSPKATQGTMMLLVSTLQDNMLNLQKDGSFELTRFDDTGATGSFHIEVKPMLQKETIVFDGSFDIPCSLPSKRCLSARK